MNHFAVLLLLLAAACTGSADSTTSGPPGQGEEKAEVVDPRTLVDVATVQVGSVADHVVASAAVESEAEATLIPETTGIVTAIHAEEGDLVTKGQVLAVIASPTLDAAWQRASAELERATADMAQVEALFAQGAVPQAERDAAERALAAARTAHEEASRTRSFTRLESPIDGVVASRTIRYGETAGGQPAFTVVDLDRLRVVVALPERDLLRVAPGQPATIVSTYDEAVSATGRVVRVAPVVDTQTGTVRVTVALDPGQRALRPGQYVSVRVEVARHDAVLTVPRRAVVWEEGRAYVFTLLEGPPPEDPDKATAAEGEGEEDEGKKEDGDAVAEGEGEGEGEQAGWFQRTFGKEEEEEKPLEIPGPWRRAHRQPVELGFEDGTLAEIRSGLVAGDVVITVGNQSLRDDARVRLPDDPTLADAKEAAEKEAAAKEAAAEGAAEGAEEPAEKGAEKGAEKTEAPASDAAGG